VCIAWNQLLHSSPEVWANIVIHDTAEYKGGAAALEHLIRLSRQSPLHLSVAVEHDGLRNLGAVLKDHIHRIVTLRLVLLTKMQPQWAAQPAELRIAGTSVAHALSMSAPLLTKLTIIDPHGIISTDSNLPIFDGAPALQQIKFAGDISTLQPRENRSLGALEVLICPIGTTEPTTEVLRDLMPTLAHANVLALDFSERRQAFDNRHSSSRNLIKFPPTLQSFFIIFSAGTLNLEQYLESIQWHLVPSIWVVVCPHMISNSHGYILNDILAAGQTPILGLSLEVASSTSINVFAYTVDVDLHALVPRGYHIRDHERREPPPGERVMLNLGHATTIPPLIFAHLRRLYISEMMFDLEVFPSGHPDSQLTVHVPQLLELTVFLMREEEHARASMFSTFSAAHISTLKAKRLSEQTDLRVSHSTCRMLLCDQLKHLT